MKELTFPALSLQLPRCSRWGHSRCRIRRIGRSCSERPTTCAGHWDTCCLLPRPCSLPRLPRPLLPGLLNLEEASKAVITDHMYVIVNCTYSVGMHVHMVYVALRKIEKEY